MIMHCDTDFSIIIYFSPYESKEMYSNMSSMNLTYQDTNPITIIRNTSNNTATTMTGVIQLFTGVGGTTAKYRKYTVHRNRTNTNLDSEYHKLECDLNMLK